MITADCLDRMLPVVADSWEKLRRGDVFRLMDSIHYLSAESANDAAGFIAARRPDLEAEAKEAADDLVAEYGLLK